MIIQFLRRNRTSILISLIVGIFLFYTQPLLTFFGSHTVSLFGAVSNRFSDYSLTAI